MTLVVDASVAVKWIVPEEQEAAAEALLLQSAHWIAPEFLLVEVGNVLRSKMSRQQLDISQAQAGLDFVATTVRRFVPDRTLTSRALEMAADLNHAIYDCLYIACAEREEARLITADRRLVAKVANSPYRSRVQVLAS